MLNIATWAQEYFRKPLSFTTVCCCIKKCNLNIYSRRKLYINYMQWSSLGHSSSQIVRKTVKMCAVLKWDHNLFPGKMNSEFSVPKTKGTIQTFISDRSKSKRLSWYGGAAEQTARVIGMCVKVPLTWRHILGLYRDIYCHQDDVFHGTSMVIISRQCQVSFCILYNSVVS